ncbi:Hypp3364 [Branchiostoma lanceolatum]|uniref:Hypp3364 protein n=1 Tax=Branchiostoma lanceolatum TaxID=7740 RepID=A0A8K0EX41_BRALA|nr:Hypp3364 [Branchiostoma lanceolatum]
MDWKVICVLLAFSMTGLSVVHLISTASGVGAIQPGSDVENLRRLLRDNFGTNRHHITNPDQKYAAKSFIYETFKEYGLQMVYQLFVTNSTKYPGVNVVGRWPGRYTDTPRDKPLVLLAHYDTSRSSGGVDDNGSGLAALLESARLITSQPCLQDHTIDFVALDLNDDEQLPDSACFNGRCGSRAYVTDMFLTYLQLNNIDPANVGGAFVLDSILNYNNTEGAQGFKDATDYFNVTSIPGVAAAFENVRKDNFRGNFITAVGREGYDYNLYGAFDLSWTFENTEPNFKFQPAYIPIKDVAKDGPSDPYWPVYSFLVQGDHYSFWAENPDLQAVLISDTGVFRGKMAQCFHLSCDNLSWITDDNLRFLKKTTDVVSSALLFRAGSPETCPDPVAAAPDAFKEGLVLKGTVDPPYPNPPYDVTFRVDSFSATGLIRARVIIDVLSTRVVGRFDSVSQQLKLRLTEPQIEGQWDMDNPVKEMAWAMGGRVTKIPGSLLYVGTANWGPWRDDPQQAAFSLFATDAEPREVSVLPSVFGTLCVLLFAVVVAMGGWILYKK